MAFGAGLLGVGATGAGTSHDVTGPLTDPKGKVDNAVKHTVTKVTDVSDGEQTSKVAKCKSTGKSGKGNPGATPQVLRIVFRLS